MASWTWASASIIGTSHFKSGIRRQDAHRCYVPENAPDFLVCVVSDGAGSANFGGEGASIVCRTFSIAAQAHLEATESLPNDEQVKMWVDSIRDRIFFAATQRSLTPRDFAATMIAVLSDSHRTLIAHVGDGCAAVKDAATGEWRIPIWPVQGEYASTTNFVTDAPEAKCTTWREETGISAIAVLSDGLERLAIDFAGKSPFAGFFDGMAKPVRASGVTGRDRILSERLAEYLDSDAVNSRTDDDKTLVVAARR